MQEIKIPSKNLLAGPTVLMDVRLKGKHHKQLTSSSVQSFERVVTDVIDDLMEGNAFALSLADIHYLFFMVRVNTLGSAYKFNWTCQREGQNSITHSFEHCGHVNEGEFDFTKLKVTEIPDGFEYPRYPIVYQDKASDVYVRLLTAGEHFEVLDDFLSDGYSVEDIETDTEALTAFAWKLLYKSLTFSNDFFNTAFSSAEVEGLFDTLDFSITSKLFQDLTYLSSLGPDTSEVKVKCGKCGGESVIRLPFSSEFLLPQR